MSKMYRVIVGALAVVASVSMIDAQVQPEVVVRQGDTIQWVVPTAPPPHKLKVGAPGTTSIDDFKALFSSITPPLNAMGESTGPSPGTLLTVVVKEDAKPGTTFVFTCGFHPADMLSLQFVVAAKGTEPARTHRIVGEPQRNWHVHVDTTP